jgi:hypothetical protein
VSIKAFGFLPKESGIVAWAIVDTHTPWWRRLLGWRPWKQDYKRVSIPESYGGTDD